MKTTTVWSTVFRFLAHVHVYTILYPPLLFNWYMLRYMLRYQDTSAENVCHETLARNDQLIDVLVKQMCIFTMKRWSSPIPNPCNKSLFCWYFGHTTFSSYCPLSILHLHPTGTICKSNEDPSYCWCITGRILNLILILQQSLWNK